MDEKFALGGNQLKSDMLLQSKILLFPIHDMFKVDKRVKIEEIAENLKREVSVR